MRAMVLEKFGAPLKLKDVPMPRIGPNDALVRVRVCGAGLTVVIMIATPGRIKSYPRIPGHEIAGEVVEVGSEVRTIKVGSRVTNHFYLTCGNCRYCRSGRETLCENFRGNVGNGCDGGYAEYVALPERNLVPIPDGVTDLEASVASDAIATPYHACHAEAQISPGDDVLIIGAGGGVGIHMVQMARLCGGRVLAAEIGEEKLELAKTMGADEVIDTRRGDLVKQVKALTGGRGVDAAIDIVATSQTLQACLGSLAPGGRMVIIGSKPASCIRRGSVIHRESAGVHAPGPGDTRLALRQQLRDRAHAGAGQAQADQGGGQQDLPAGGGGAGARAAAEECDRGARGPNRQLDLLPRKTQRTRRKNKNKNGTTDEHR